MTRRVCTFLVGVSAGLLILSAVTYTASGVTAAKTKPATKVTASRAAKTRTVALPSTERAWVQRWMKGMTLRDEIAQLIMITSYGEALSSRSSAYREFVHLVRDVRVGGIIVVNRVANGSVRYAEPYAMATFLNRMQKLARVPLLVGADFERGASMRVSGTPKFPHLMAYGAAKDLALTRYLGLATAREGRALGIQWVFAPDADVNNNPDNPIINIRSFGEDSKDVATQVQAFIEGARSDPQNRVLVTAKHFPGHGDTSVDSHMGLAVLSVARDRLEQVELTPFRAAIANNVDAIMTAHVALPSVEKEEIPATVSPAVLTGLLREELKFNGLIVTDAMDMQGLTRIFPNGEASVRAIEAGADVLLMPAHPDEVVRAVSAAVQSGRLSRKRIQQSVSRILAAKARVGLQKSKLVNLEGISEDIDSTESTERAQAAADKAVTLIRNENNLLPLKQPTNACLFLLAENRYGQQGRKMNEEVQKRTTMRTLLMDPLMPQLEIDQALQKYSDCGEIVVAAFVTASAYRGNVALAGNLPAFVNGLLQGKTPVILISLGNPYLLRSFPAVGAYMATFSPATTSETAAVKALFGEIPITGKMPVSIPGLAQIGDGLSMERKQ